MEDTKSEKENKIFQIFLMDDFYNETLIFISLMIFKTFPLFFGVSFKCNTKIYNVKGLM